MPKITSRLLTALADRYAMQVENCSENMPSPY